MEILKPWLRTLKYNWLQRSAEYKISQSNLSKKNLLFPPPTFLIGCGRSGTTILGQVLSLHNEVSYFFEPYHLWAAIDPLTDVLNLYHRVDAYFLMDALHCHEEAQIRFNRLFLENLPNKNSLTVIEKTPLNAMRIGYINALAPRAKFIHIVRDGVDVSCSIEQIASISSYKIAGKPQLNQWWGVENYRWKALSRDGASAGYYPDEVDLLENHRSKGAYEWLVSLGEVDRWREKISDRLYEITYEELTANPEATLGNICKFLELDTPSGWLNEATKMINPANQRLREPISLPPAMCDTFNHYQERFGFVNRASSLECV